MAKKVSIRCAPAASASTAGLKAYRAPTSQAMLSDEVHLVATHMAARPERNGAATSATLTEAIGPKIAVIGRSTAPSAIDEVLANRLVPIGWNTAVEKNGFMPWRMATQSHSKYQAKREESEQGHVVARVGDSRRTRMNMPRPPSR